MTYWQMLARISPRYRTRKPGRLCFWSMCYYREGRYIKSVSEE